MSKGQLFSWAIVVLTLVAAIGGLGWLGWNQPLAPALQVTVEPTSLPKVTGTPEPPPFQPTATLPAPVAATQPACGSAQGVLTVLVLGENSPTDLSQRGADAIRLVKVDFDSNTVTILVLPPTLLVQTAQTVRPLTGLYYISKNNVSGDERQKTVAAVNALAQALATNFSVAPAHYLMVKPDAFKNLVDAVRGIEIDVPSPVDGSAQKMGSFGLGRQLLDGQRAFDYMRILETGSASAELRRLTRQDQVFKALYARLLEPVIVTNLPDLAGYFYQNVVTDFSPAQMYALVCLLQNPTVRIEYRDFGRGLAQPDANGNLTPIRAEVVRFLQAGLLR
jgi:LCP family protein required for cell wall assembly